MRVFSIILLILSLFLLTMSCSDNNNGNIEEETNPCENITCDNQGVCVQNEEGDNMVSPVRCECNEGYHAEDMNCIKYDIEKACDIDKIKNTFKLTAPANEAVIFRNRKFVVSLTDGISENIPLDIEKVEYWADNKSILLGISTTFPYSMDIDTSILSNGEHTIEAIIYDSCNNEVHSQQNTIISYGDSFKDAHEYHVTVDGTPEGNGSVESPWDVQTAFGNYIAGVVIENPVIKPGDIIWIHAGDYDDVNEAGGYKTFLHGTKEKPIIVRAYGDGMVKIHIGDSSALESSSWNWFWGLEPHVNRPDRSTKDGYTRPQGFYFQQEGHSIINCIVSNNGHPGIGTWVGVGEGEIYGTIIWGNGIYHYKPETDSYWTRGSAIYTQNQNGIRKIRDVIAFKNFTNSIKPYTEQGYVDNFHIEGNIVFKTKSSPIIVEASNNPVQNLKVINNYTFKEENDGVGTAVALGFAYRNLNNNGLTLTGNYFVGGSNYGGVVSISQWDNLTVKNNIFITKYFNNNDGLATPRLFSFIPSDTQINTDWNNNTYYGGRDISLGNDNLINIHTDWINASDRNANYDRLFTLEGWQNYDLLNTPADQDSRWIRNNPENNVIFVRPNLYERGRGHIAIYNWEDLAEVEVDISDLGLDEGETFEIYDVENFYGDPVLTDTYSHSKITVKLPMNLTEVSPVIGDITHMDSSLTHTSSKFAAFVVLKK